MLTNLIQHFVALVKNKVLDISKRESFVSYKSIQSTWCTNDDVGILLLVLQKLDILSHRCTTIEDSRFDLGKVFAESSIFILDLVGQLSCVTHDENLAFTLNGFQRMQCGQNEDSRLT